MKEKGLDCLVKATDGKDHKFDYLFKHHVFKMLVSDLNRLSDPNYYREFIIMVATYVEFFIDQIITERLSKIYPHVEIGNYNFAEKIGKSLGKLLISQEFRLGLEKRIKILKCLINNDNLISILQEINTNRNKIAHNINVTQIKMEGKDFSPLTNKQEHEKMIIRYVDSLIELNDVHIAMFVENK